MEISASLLSASSNADVLEPMFCIRDVEELYRSDREAQPQPHMEGVIMQVHANVRRVHSYALLFIFLPSPRLKRDSA